MRIRDLDGNLLEMCKYLLDEKYPQSPQKSISSGKFENEDEFKNPGKINENNGINFMLKFQDAQ